MFCDPVKTQIIPQEVHNFFKDSYPKEIWSEIIMKLDSENILTWCFVNKAFHWCISQMPDAKLFRIFPTLKQIDTGYGDKLPINCIEIIKGMNRLSPLVEGDEGCTLLTMREGQTLNQLVKIAHEAGIKIEFSWDEILEKIGDIPVPLSYLILITNTIFKKTREMTQEAQEKYRIELKCEIPSVLEKVALCVFTLKNFPENCPYGKEAFGRTSTTIDNYSLLVGGCSPTQLTVNYSFLYYESPGIGGIVKMSPPRPRSNLRTDHQNHS